MKPKPTLRLEGLAVFAVSLIIYWKLELSWTLFLVLFMVPDISILFYFVNYRLGAFFYNVCHTYIFPAILLVVGIILQGTPYAMPAALIWSAHIGADRFLGFGLKYKSSFNDTHFRRL